MTLRYFDIQNIRYWAVGILKPKLGYDDTLDIFGIYGGGGAWGGIAVGLFASIW